MNRSATALSVASGLLALWGSAARAGDGDVVLIHTGDFHGHLTPRANVRADDVKGRMAGGLARVHTKIKQIRAEQPSSPAPPHRRHHPGFGRWALHARPSDCRWTPVGPEHGARQLRPMTAHDTTGPTKARPSERHAMRWVRCHWPCSVGGRPSEGL